jgi:hypothetical protein
VRRQLAAQGEKLAGLYAGNAKRETAHPTAERLLEAFQEMPWTVVVGATQTYRHLTALDSFASAHSGAFGAFFASVYKALHRF